MHYDIIVVIILLLLLLVVVVVYIINNNIKNSCLFSFFVETVKQLNALCIKNVFLNKQINKQTVTYLNY